MSSGVDYTTTGLVASVTRRVILPEAQNLYTPDDLILFMGDELSSTIIPLIHSVQQEYWVYRVDVPLVANQLTYTIPYRGIVNGLRLLTLVDPSGNEIEFPMLRPENTASTYNWLSPYSTSTLYGFYMEDDHVVVFPQQVVSNPVMSFRFRYERLPNQLCDISEAAQITTVNSSTLVTVSNIPTDWIANSTTLDLIQGTPNFKSKGDDLILTNINVGTAQLTVSNLPSTVAAGDWLAQSGLSPIPQIPIQCFPYLAQCVAQKVLEGMADMAPYNAATQKVALMKEDLLKVLQPRDMGNVQTIINRGGLFDSGQFWGWPGGIYW